MLFASPYADQYTLSRDGAGAAQEVDWRRFERLASTAPPPQPLVSEPPPLLALQVDWRRFVSAIDHPKLGAKPDQALQNYLDRMQVRMEPAFERPRIFPLP